MCFAPGRVPARFQPGLAAGLAAEGRPLVRISCPQFVVRACFLWQMELCSSQGSSCSLLSSPDSAAPCKESDQVSTAGSSNPVVSPHLGLGSSLKQNRLRFLLSTARPKHFLFLVRSSGLTKYLVFPVCPCSSRGLLALTQSSVPSQQRSLFLPCCLPACRGCVHLFLRSGAVLRLFGKRQGSVWVRAVPLLGKLQLDCSSQENTGCTLFGGEPGQAAALLVLLPQNPTSWRPGEVCVCAAVLGACGGRRD